MNPDTHPTTPAVAWHIRPATTADIPDLIALRRLMFESMGYRDEAALERMSTASTHYMAETLPTGEIRAWVAEANGQVVAGGAIVIHSAPPTIRNLDGREGYIMNVATLPQWRCQGIATALLHVMLDALRAADITAVSLHASEEGRPIYVRAGFWASNEMRLFLGEAP